MPGKKEVHALIDYKLFIHILQGKRREKELTTIIRA
jgi:hypothetical protein